MTELKVKDTTESMATDVTEPVARGAKGILLKVVLLFSSVDGMVASALMVPLLGNIAMEFSDASPGMLNQLISLPSLLMIPAIIITGLVAQYISKKYLLMIGSFIFVVAGFGSMYSPNLETLVIFRAIEGVGMGIVYPLAPAIIAHLFYGHERAQLLGWSNSCGSFFSVVLGIGAGYAALINWRYAFYYYLIFVAVIVMQAILLPAFPAEKKDKSIVKSVETSAEKPRMGMPVYLTVIAMLVFMTIAMPILYNLSIFIISEGIGNSANAGTASSIITLSSLVISFFFANLFKGLRRFTSVLSLVFMALAYYILSTAHAYPTVILGTIFFGLSMGTMFPYLMTRVSLVASKAVKTMAVSVLSMAIYLGQFFSGYLSSFLSNLSAGSIRGVFSMVSICFLVCAIFALIFILGTRKKDSQWLSAEIE